MDVQLPIIGIGITVEVAADHRLRLVPFGDAGRLEAVLHSRPDVESDEIDEIGAEQQQLRHDRIIVVGGRQVAVAALLGFGPPYGMREVRREGLARKARRRDRRLRSEEHTSELQSLMRISYAVFCLKKKKIK